MSLRSLKASDMSNVFPKVVVGVIGNGVLKRGALNSILSSAPDSFASETRIRIFTRPVSPDQTTTEVAVEWRVYRECGLERLHDWAEELNTLYRSDGKAVTVSPTFEDGARDRDLYFPEVHKQDSVELPDGDTLPLELYQVIYQSSPSISIRDVSFDTITERVAYSLKTGISQDGYIRDALRDIVEKCMVRNIALFFHNPQDPVRWVWIVAYDKSLGLTVQVIHYTEAQVPEFYLPPAVILAPEDFIAALSIPEMCVPFYTE